MKYVSKPVEIEARQWIASDIERHAEMWAYRIVDWVNANGGEARYEQGSVIQLKALSFPEIPYPPTVTPARIAVRTINGWAYAAPGHYIVKGSEKFDPDDKPWGERKVLLDFYPCDPETFEQRWEPVP